MTKKITTPTYLGTTQQHTNTHASRYAAQMNPNKETSNNNVWMNGRCPQEKH
jgi:hypothetical protein